MFNDDLRSYTADEIATVRYYSKEKTWENGGEKVATPGYTRASQQTIGLTCYAPATADDADDLHNTRTHVTFEFINAALTFKGKLN